MRTLRKFLIEAALVGGLAAIDAVVALGEGVTGGASPVDVPAEGYPVLVTLLVLQAIRRLIRDRMQGQPA